MKICPKCSAGNDDDVFACRICGEPLLSKLTHMTKSKINVISSFALGETCSFQEALEIRRGIQRFHKQALAIKTDMEKASEALSKARIDAETTYHDINLVEADRFEQQVKYEFDTSMGALDLEKNWKENELKQRVAELSTIQQEFDLIISNDKQYIAWLKSILGEFPQRLVNKYTKSVKMPSGKPDLEALRRLYEKTVDKTPQLGILGREKLGGYYALGDMQRDVIIQTQEAILYLQEEIPRAARDCKTTIEKKKQQIQSDYVSATEKRKTSLEKIAAVKQAGLEKAQQMRQAALRQFELEQQQILELEEINKKKWAAVVAKENHARNEFFCAPLIQQFVLRTINEARGSGLSSKDWTAVTDTESRHSALGWVLLPLNVGSQSLVDRLGKEIEALFTNQCIRIPALYPVDQRFCSYIQFSETQKQNSAGFVQRFVLEKIRANRVGRVETFFFDPNDRGDNLGVLIETAKANEEIGIFVNNDRRGIRDILAKIVERIDKLNGQLGSCPSIYKYNKKDDLDEPIHETVLIFMDFEDCIDRESLPLVEVILNQSNKYGIDVLFLSKHPCAALPSCFPNEKMDFSFIQHAEPLFITFNQTGTLMNCGGEICGFLPCGISAHQKGYLAQYRAQITEHLKVKNDFGVFFDADKEYRYRDATSGISLPILVKNTPGGGLSELVIGTTSSTHTLVTGSIGSGKSTFLHMLISSVIMNYHPDDVELWLLDYGRVEFVDYLNNTPPHVRFLSLEKSEEFTFSFLDFLKKFFTEREEKLQKENCANLQEYRSVYGPHSLPRVLLIVDEFHVMTQHIHHEIGYRNILENALTEYRKFGLSCVFSNQTISGLTGLTDTARLQIRNRIAMASSIQEMKETLAVQSDNYSPAQLTAMERTATGEMWLKEWVSASDFKIENFKAIHISKTEREHVLLTSMRRGATAKADQMNYVLDGAGRVQLPQESISNYLFAARMQQGNSGLQFCLGTPTSIEKIFSFKIEEKYNNNILLAGRDTGMTVDLLIALCYSALQAKNLRVVVLADDSDQVYREFSRKTQNKAYLKSIQILTDYDRICSWVYHVHEQVEAKSTSRERTLAIWLGYCDLYDEFAVCQPKPARHEDNARHPQESFTVNPEGAASRDPALMQMAESMGLSVKEVISLLGEASQPEVQDPQMSMYNANADILDLFAKGGKYGVFNIVPIEFFQSIQRIRGFETRHFLHKIAMSMPREESRDWGLRDRAEELQAGITALYSNGISTQTFRPYICD